MRPFMKLNSSIMFSHSHLPNSFLAFLVNYVFFGHACCSFSDSDQEAPVCLQVWGPQLDAVFTVIISGVLFCLYFVFLPFFRV